MKVQQPSWEHECKSYILKMAQWKNGEDIWVSDGFIEPLTFLNCLSLDLNE